MNRTLDLVLIGKWFDMISSGIKTEEYREIKPYWAKRLDKGNPYKKVKFRKGYTKISCCFEIVSIEVGFGKPEWGAPKGREVYIIKFKSLCDNG